LKVSRKENESVNFKNQQLIESASEKKDIDKGGNAKEELLPGKKNEKGSRSIKGNEGLRESDNNSNQNQGREKNDNGKDETLELKSVNKEKETMSKEKALKILDAMQKEEIIYLQQLQRKPENKEDSGEY
jgi:hypothetical protein